MTHENSRGPSNVSTILLLDSPFFFFFHYYPKNLIVSLFREEENLLVERSSTFMILCNFFLRKFQSFVKYFAKSEVSREYLIKNQYSLESFPHFRSRNVVGSDDMMDDEGGRGGGWEMENDGG